MVSANPFEIIIWQSAAHWKVSSLKAYKTYAWFLVLNYRCKPSNSALAIILLSPLSLSGLLIKNS
jgi:hypothetical protein